MGLDLQWLTGALALVLALVHLTAPRIEHRFGRGTLFRSMAGGVAVAYVLLVLLPEVARHQGVLGGPGVRDVWYVALAGFAIFLWLRQASEGRGPRPSGHALNVVAFSVFVLYYAVVGYSLHAQETALDASIFALAIGLHASTGDETLRERHPWTYRRGGRYALTVAVPLGWGTAALLSLPRSATALPLAFLAGAVILNVLHDELPHEGSRVHGLLLGLAVYAGLQALR